MSGTHPAPSNGPQGGQTPLQTPQQGNTSHPVAATPITSPTSRRLSFASPQDIATTTQMTSRRVAALRAAYKTAPSPQALKNIEALERDLDGYQQELLQATLAPPQGPSNSGPNGPQGAAVTNPGANQASAIGVPPTQATQANQGGPVSSIGATSTTRSAPSSSPLAALLASQNPATSSSSGSNPMTTSGQRGQQASASHAQPTQASGFGGSQASTAPPGPQVTSSASQGPRFQGAAPVTTPGLASNPK